MLIKKQVVEFKFAVFAVLLGVSVLANASFAESKFHLEKDAKGSIQPFKAITIPLSDFLQEYSRISGVPMTVGGVWSNELKGSVTLLIRKTLKPQEMTEVVYRVLNDNGYAVVDAPAGNGWVIQRGKDARDSALPVYESTEVPETSRLITAHLTLKYIDSEGIARMMRSFMPANSRIIPGARSQLLITDTGLNIRKLLPVIARMDTEEAAKKYKSFVPYNPNQKACGEQRIEKLVVEKLEIQESGSTNFGQITNQNLNQRSNMVPATQQIMKGARK